MRSGNIPAANDVEDPMRFTVNLSYAGFAFGNWPTKDKSPV